MPELSIVLGAYERTGDPTLVARNLYTEQVATPAGAKNQLRVRPGLSPLAKIGQGPLRGIAQKDGLFDGSAVLLSRRTLLTVTAEGQATPFTGAAIPGDSLVDIALGQDADLNSVAYIATGTALYKAVSGAVTLDSSFPAGGASSVDYIAGYFVAVQAGTDMFYYLVPGGATWEPLDFASAEYAPDPLVAVRARGEQIAMLGTTTFQVFALSGDGANPITPYGGLNFDFGCRSRTSAVNCAGALIWVDNQSNVRRWDGGGVKIISTPGLAELIASVPSDELVAWSFAIPGHRFYVLRIGNAATWVYDLQELGDRWVTFDSLGLPYWRAQLGCNVGSDVLACDATTAQMYHLEDGRRMDGADAVPMGWSALVVGADEPQAMANLVLVCDLGDAPRTGQGSEPIVQMRWSDNEGKSFSGWRERPLGATGVNKPMPKWNALGTVPAHIGRILEFRISDPVGRVIRAIKANVP
ncbi:hypothetical protein [Phenylobacterium deserti]|nr:hypothetical protein [Phenylobacterium deserti]